jgi:hypothetical protein
VNAEHTSQVIDRLSLSVSPEFILLEESYLIDCVRRGIWPKEYDTLLQQASALDERNLQWYRTTFDHLYQLCKVHKVDYVEQAPASIADYCNVQGELDRVLKTQRRVQDVYGDSFETVEQILDMADYNLQTAVDEILLRNTSLIGYKRVFNPETSEDKFVFFNPARNLDEDWREAWKREDVRLSFLRAIGWFPEHLELRDWILLRTFNNLCHAWADPSSSSGKTYFWISPPPIDAGYGYGTIALEYVYAVQPQRSANQIEIHGRTHITEFSRGHYRRLVQEIIHPEDVSIRRIQELPEEPSDIDFLSFSFTTTSTVVHEHDLRSYLLQLEEKMTQEYVDLHARYPLHFQRQRDLVQSRLSDPLLVKELHDGLSRIRAQYTRYLRLQKSEREIRDLLRDEYQKEAEELYIRLKTQERAAEFKAAGKTYTEADQHADNARFKARVKENLDNGSCPHSVSRRESGGASVALENRNGEWYLNGEKVEERTIACQGLKGDSPCGWSGRNIVNGRLLMRCPSCGWHPCQGNLVAGWVARQKYLQELAAMSTARHADTSVSLQIHLTPRDVVITPREKPQRKTRVFYDEQGLPYVPILGMRHYIREKKTT